MNQKQRLKTRTVLDLEHLEEIQRVTDRNIVPNCVRRTQVLNYGLGALALVVGICCAVLGQQPLVGLVFGAVGVFFLVRGAMIYRVVARMTQKRVDKAAETTEYIMEKPYIWGVNGRGDTHYPYSSCIRLLETTRNFYVVTDQGRTIMLDKGNLTGGTADDLRDWLEERCQMEVEQVGPDWTVQQKQNQKSEENPE